MSCLIWFQDFCRFFFLWTFSQLLSVLQIVSCLKVRSTGLRFFSLSLVVVVVLLYLTVRAALGKRKSVETSWAAIIEFCAAANWCWRAYYFLCRIVSVEPKWWKRTVPFLEKFSPLFLIFLFCLFLYFFLFSHQWRSVCTVIFHALVCIQISNNFLWSLFLFSRARAEKIKYFFHGKPSGP
jgi:hypothetical protein